MLMSGVWVWGAAAPSQQLERNVLLRYEMACFSGPVFGTASCHFL
jgi:hypothetical protein